MTILKIVVVAAALLATATVLPSCSRAAAGPNGGDLVPLGGEGNVTAEVLANADTGEVMVHTWDADLGKAHPVAAEPMIVGGGEDSMQLDPRPLESDPAGYCSRFYGSADWVRHGGIRHGWLRHSGDAEAEHHFTWDRCWKGGARQQGMWSGMGGHGRGKMHDGTGGGMKHG